MLGRTVRAAETSGSEHSFVRAGIVSESDTCFAAVPTWRLTGSITHTSGAIPISWNSCYFESGSLDFGRAKQEYERAVALAPGNSRILGNYGGFAVMMGDTEAGLAAVRRAQALDPLNRANGNSLGNVLVLARQYTNALSAYQDALALEPERPDLYGGRGLAYYLVGDLEHARSSCESRFVSLWNQQCLAITYDKLGRHADAESVLAKLKASMGDAGAFQYCEIYAQWGNTAQALNWLETALRLRDPGLELVKGDPLLDPLRREPRFQSVMRELKFPE